MLSRLRTYASFIKFSHTVFALPFALAGAVLAARVTPLTWTRIGWILAAMFTARTAAMGFNRLVDARFDARNPRRPTGELPRGVMTTWEAAALVAVASLAFVGVTYLIDPLCFRLSPLALAIVFWYSLASDSRPTRSSSSAWPWPWPRWGAGWPPADGRGGRPGCWPSGRLCGWLDSTFSTRARTSTSIEPIACGPSRSGSASSGRC